MTAVRQAVSAILRGTAISQRLSAQSSSVSRITGRNVTLAALALAAGFNGHALAQDAAPAESTGAGALQPMSLDEVTVTGSRIRRKTDFDTANPTTVVNGDYLRSLGIANVSQAVAMLPSNVSTFSATSTGNSNFFAGSTIANLRGLNPFFGSRTLNLVNERRFVPTNQGDGVDLNFLPFIMVERVDVVTGGASAAYGSGAISGVNNIVLNRKLEGGLANIDFGQTQESDGRDRQVGLAYGMPVLSDRGHVSMGVEYGKSDEIGCFNAREWCREGNAFIPNPVVAPGLRADGSSDLTGPSLILARDARFNQLSQSGVFNSFDPNATTTLQANAAGTGTTGFNLGQQPFATASPFNNVSGGDGESIYQYTNLRAPVERNVALASFTYEVTDTTTLTADVSWGKVETDNRTQALAARFNAIAPNNAFLAGNSDLIAAQSAYAIFPGGPAFLNKDWTSQVNSHSLTETTVNRMALGLDGVFGLTTWRWDGYVQYGKAEREQTVFDNRHLNAYNLAIDSIIGPGGTPVCRIASEAQAIAAGVTFDPRLANGCVPLNPFGTGQISDAARAYAFGNLNEQLDYEQTVVAANFSGELFAGWGAGAITAAAGAEYRIEEGENIAAVPAGTPDYVRTDYLIQYGESFAGKVNVTEGYLETIIPFLKDVTAAKLLELDTAVRYSEYNNQGGFGTTGDERTHGMVTWKAALKWQPLDWLLFRGTQSRDSRAANFRELYYGQIIGAGGLFGFCGPNQTDPCTFSLEGNIDLDPEKSDTTTLGFVFTPSQAVPTLQVSADYFRIEITDAIQQASSPRVLNGCRISGIQEFCDLITPDVPGDFSSVAMVRALAFNGSGYVYKGVDLSGSYQWELGNAGSMNFRLLATRMIDQNFQNVPGGPFVNVVGQTGTGNSFLSDNQPTAKWQSTLSATYLRGPLSVTGTMRYVSDGIMDYLAVLPGETVPTGGRVVSQNRVPSYQVYGLSGSYEFNDVGPMPSVTLYGAVSNLFDKDPPIAVGGGAFGAVNNNGGTNSIFFDTLGRSFKIGLRAEF
jgi:iron complex outermembrane recepter protein